MSGIPNATPGGWTRTETVGPHVLLTYPDGEVRFQHQCDRGDRGVIVCAPRLQLRGGGHGILYSSHGGTTVTPSILCDDCGTHGFVRDGEWVPA